MVDQSADVVVTFTGSLTVRNCEQIKRQLLDGLAGADGMRIDCAGVAEVDVSFVQLLLGARRSAERAGKRLAMAHPVDGPLLVLLRSAGLLPPLGGAATADSVFWKGE